MPSVEEHVSQAKANEAFATAMGGGDATLLRAWRVTITYYAAAHLGRAFVRKRKPTIVIESHKSFESVFLVSGGKPDDYKHYRRMKDLSERARYDCKPPNDAELGSMIANHYAPFKSSMLNSLGIHNW